MGSAGYERKLVIDGVQKLSPKPEPLVRVPCGSLLELRGGFGLRYTAFMELTCAEVGEMWCCADTAWTKLGRVAGELAKTIR